MVAILPPVVYNIILYWRQSVVLEMQVLLLLTSQQQPPPRSSFGTDNNASAFSSPRASIIAKISNNKGGLTGDTTRKPFNNAASQPDYEKKFVC
jgi:hypothetical protein